MTPFELAVELRKAIEAGIPIRANVDGLAEFQRASFYMEQWREQLTAVEAQIAAEEPSEWHHLI